MYAVPVRRSVVAFVLVVAGTTALGANAAQAQVPCADVTIASNEKLYMPDHLSSAAFAVNVPAGDYRILATSSDAVHADGFQVEQTAEQWRFVTDSGFVSAATADLAEGVTEATFDLGVVTLPVTSSITFRHAQLGSSAGSVQPSLKLACVASGTGSPVPSSEASTSLAPTSEVQTSLVQTSLVQAPTTEESVGAVAPSSTVASAVVTAPQAVAALPRTGNGTGLAWLGAGLLMIGGAVLVGVRRKSAAVFEVTTDQKSS
ncbi:MAG: LPXTG-motif cell wall-anchored protein [Candidatus Poriferisodalaceae bacterium]|jgi:LPXTG-motif cell wall-anchored protein